MLRIWDSGQQAYRQPEFIRRYDAQSGAWVGCQAGKAQKEGIWEEVWPDAKILYLYKNGDECTDITGGWTYFDSRSLDSIVTTNGFETVKQIPFSGYRKINFRFTCQRSVYDHIEFSFNNEVSQPLVGAHENINGEKQVTFDLGETGGKLSLYLKSNTYREVSRSGNKKSEYLEVSRAYAGATMTIHIYEIYLSR